jgi:phage repressor protein C with HTH and peptisase S24 domain
MLTTDIKMNREFKPLKGCPYKPTKVCEKLKEYFYENGMKQVDIAKALCTTQTNISNQLNGRPFGTTTALSWSDTFGFSIRWLLTGEGSMFDNHKPLYKLPADSIVYNKPEYFDDKIPLIPAWLFKAPETNIPEYLTTHKNIEYLPPVPHFPKHTLFAICPGDAMSPKISKGDIVALQGIEDNEEINNMNGEIYVIDTYSQGIFIRKMISNKCGMVTCIPINKDHFKQFDIPTTDIINAYKVVGWLTINN